MESSKKVVWITGASRGIGLAIAQQLLNKDFNLVLGATNLKSFKDFNEEIAKNPNVFLMPGDISNYNIVNEINSKISNSLGSVDILINNAGNGIFKLFTELTAEEFDKMNSVNYKGLFNTIKAVLPAMIEKKAGVIINIISVSAQKSFPYSSVYGSSKSAACNMTNTLREEVRQFGIKIINVFPGATDTDIWQEPLRSENRHKMMQPIDIAQAVGSIIELSNNNRMMIEEIFLKPQLGDI